MTAVFVLFFVGRMLTENDTFRSAEVDFLHSFGAFIASIGGIFLSKLYNARILFQERLECVLL